MDNVYVINEDYYYVYEHWLDGKVVYVGKGKGDRALKASRNDFWKDVVRNNLFNVDVVIKAYFKDEKDALDYEESLIYKHLKNNEQLTNIASGNIQPGYKRETEEYKEKVEIEVSKEIDFFQNKEMKTIVKENIKDGNKILIFSRGTNSRLKEEIEEVKKAKVLELSLINSNYDSKLIDKINNGFIPNPYNVMIFPTELFSVSNLKIKEDRVNSVVIHDKFIDKNIVLRRLNKNIDFLYLKKPLSKAKNKKLDHSILKKYLNRTLTTKEKNKLCEELNLLNDRGALKKWTSIKRHIKNSGYKIEETFIYTSNKQMRASIITLDI